MCGRYLLRAPKREISQAFEVLEENLPVIRYGRYNIAPTQEVIAILLPPGAERRELVSLRWGLIPPWSKDLASAAKLINARSETAHEKPSFRGALKERRCLIIADGFYEWQNTESGKRPHFFFLKSGKIFAFAGLSESWRNPATGEELRTCCILTTNANAVVRPVHDRMPVILTTPEEWNEWLSPMNSNPSQLLRPLADELLDCYPVGRLVNNTRNESPECIEREAA